MIKENIEIRHELYCDTKDGYQTTECYAKFQGNAYCIGDRDGLVVKAIESGWEYHTVFRKWTCPKCIELKKKILKSLDVSSIAFEKFYQ